MEVYTFTQGQVQKLLNDQKDNLLERVNKDHNLSIDPAEYLFVPQTGSCLGRVLEKVFGKTEPDSTRFILIRRYHD